MGDLFFYRGSGMSDAKALKTKQKSAEAIVAKKFL